MLSISKQVLVCIVFLLVGFIAGVYFQDHYGAPKTTQEVTIKKQKIKGDGNTSQTDFQLNQSPTQANGETDKDKGKRGFIRRIFGRRRHERDTTDYSGEPGHD